MQVTKEQGGTSGASKPVVEAMDSCARLGLSGNLATGACTVACESRPTAVSCPWHPDGGCGYSCSVSWAAPI